MYNFYILRCKDGSLYSGITKDLKNRLRLHNSGKGSVYVKTHGGGKIVYSEKYTTIGNAMHREAEVKRWPRAKKLLQIRTKHKI